MGPKLHNTNMCKVYLPQVYKINKTNAKLMFEDILKYYYPNNSIKISPPELYFTPARCVWPEPLTILTILLQTLVY